MNIKLVNLSIISILLIAGCMHRSDHLDSRVKYNFETETITPLNKEACLYLSYKNLLEKNTDEAQAYLDKSKDLPGSSLEELKEGLKTIECLVLLNKKKYATAEEKIKGLANVIALPEPKTNIEVKTYHMYRRIRGASIQLRNSLPALIGYNKRAEQKSMNTKEYEVLKKNWSVKLTGSEYGKMYKVNFPFPEFLAKE